MTSVPPPQEGAHLVIVDYEDVLKDPSPDHSLASLLEKAYGSSASLGVLAIRNVPGFVQAKQAFLPMAHTLAHLPKDYLEDKLTDGDSMYNAGWSHGKEKLGDEPDWAKGSFYFNPLTDQPGSAEDQANFPASYPCNIWPDRIPNFEQNAKHIGTLMKDVVVHLSKHLDAFAHGNNSDYAPGTLYEAMKTTEKAKGRLLYYFPISSKNAASEDSWIGWHNDSGFLTALAGDFYVNDETGEVLTKPPDPSAGLYVVDRDDNVVHVSIPDDCMAVQMGECVQILTGGSVVATPHCVRGASSENHTSVARISLPCFIDMPPHVPLCMPPCGCTREQVLSAGVGSSRVPPLSARWTHDGMLFGEFLRKTFSLYYDWSKGE
jgi:isopenicillin N synthase-like dioxygenase